MKIDVTRNAPCKGVIDCPRLDTNSRRSVWGLVSPQQSGSRLEDGRFLRGLLEPLVAGSHSDFEIVVSPH